MSVIVAIFCMKVNTTFGLLVPLLPWENYPTGYFVFVDLVTMVIYFDFAWLVVY